MRRSSLDHLARCTPVHPFASTGRSAPLASMRCVETTLPSFSVVTSTASPNDGVMHTIGPLAGAGANADSPAGAAVQHPIQPCHLGPAAALVCCAGRALEAIARMPSAATQCFIVMFIVDVLMDEA